MAEDGDAGVSADILASIDGALRDYELSADAMRWLPEEKREAPPALAPVFVPVTLDLEPFTRALEEAGRVLRRFFADVGAAVAKLAPLLTEAADGTQEAAAAPYSRVNLTA